MIKSYWQYLSQRTVVKIKRDNACKMFSIVKHMLNAQCICHLLIIDVGCVYRDDGGSSDG